MSIYPQVFFLVILGLAVGSFLSALTYRLPRGISISDGRSFCDKCRKRISWYDNIPLFSYFVIKGKCRYCGKKISVRYPLIELSCTLGFIGIFALNNLCSTSFKGPSFKGGIFCTWNSYLGVVSLPIFLLIFSLVLAIFIIDLENNIIPDNLVFILYATIVSALILTHMENFYLYLLSGFLMADFLLFLHVVTKGKGMGLGDVKFALFAGTLLGFPDSLVWLLLAFLTGGLIGIILILLKKARLKSRIAFGPILSLSLAITVILGKLIINKIFS